jgi:hypothetical protein
LVDFGFRFAIRKFKLKTPDREDETEEAGDASASKGGDLLKVDLDYLKERVPSIYNSDCVHESEAR